MIAGECGNSAKSAPEIAADLERLSISLERSGGGASPSRAYANGRRQRVQ
jgi:hypothetical protein